MEARLYIVGTPIGNLADLSFRAKETLSSVDYIACEDTRHSLVLLKHYDIKKPLIPYHKFNEQESSLLIIQHIHEGKSVALITDAGMPGISDPGAILVSAAREAGIEVESVPGPTALTTAYSISGLKENGFVFLGFLPEKEGAKIKLISEYEKSSLPIILYCAPHDVVKTIQLLKDCLGDRRVVIVKEISKMFEKVVSGLISSINIENVKGEFVLIIEPQKLKVTKEEICKSLDEALKSGLKKSEAVKLVSDTLDVPKNEVYSISLENK